MPLWDSLAGLAVRVDSLAVQRRELAREQWTRVTTTVVLHGDGATGEGEDVTYEAAAHHEFPADVDLAGSWSLDDFSRRLEELDLTDFRRWAFESAALDLGLRQRGVSLGELVGRPYQPVRFVASTRSEIGPYLELNPKLEFKLDAGVDWDRPFMLKLAGYDRVRVVDLKAYYRGTSVDLAPDPELYRAVVECFPASLIEDPWLEDGCREALAVRDGAQARRVHRSVREARHEHVRRRTVRARSGQEADPEACEPLLSRRPKRCRAVGVQRRWCAAGLGDEPTARSRRDRLLSRPAVGRS